MFNNLTNIIIIGLAGMGIGSNYSPNVINRYGHFNTFVGCNFITVIAKLLQLVEWFPAMMFGRFIFGVTAAI